MRSFKFSNVNRIRKEKSDNVFPKMYDCMTGTRLLNELVLFWILSVSILLIVLASSNDLHICRL